MIEKHKMIAGFEHLTYSSEMLRECWDKSADHFKSLVSGGWTNMGVVALINHIRQTEYAGKFFPGSSLGTLLISKPGDGRLNYQQTLAISADRLTNKITLRYSDWDIIDNEENMEKTFLWTKECTEEQLKDIFEEFLKWNTKWR